MLAPDQNALSAAFRKSPMTRAKVAGLRGWCSRRPGQPTRPTDRNERSRRARLRVTGERYGSHCPTPHVGTPRHNCRQARRAPPKPRPSASARGSLRLQLLKDTETIHDLPVSTQTPLGEAVRRHAGHRDARTSRREA